MNILELREAINEAIDGISLNGHLPEERQVFQQIETDEEVAFTTYEKSPSGITIEVKYSDDVPDAGVTLLSKGKMRRKCL